MPKFNCDSCGICCKLIGIKPLGFPYRVINNRCEMLGINDRCKIYNNRPLMCNVEKYAETMGIDKELFFKRNEEACRYLKSVYEKD